MTVSDASDVEDFIAHYGVKGMKWGQSKEQKLANAVVKDKVLRVEKKAAKQNLKAAIKPVIRIRIDDMFAPEKQAVRYADLKKDKITIEKGQEFARITKRGNEVLRDKTFVSYRKDDRETYKAVMPVNGSKRGKNYEYVYSATKKLNGPSEKERVDMFIELLGKPSIEHRGKKITGREFLESQGLKRELRNLDNTQAGLREYRRQTAFGVMHDTPLGTAYLSEVRNRGYNLLTDDNDRKVLSRDPIIILDPNGSIQRMSVRELSNREVNQAQQTFTVGAEPRTK